MGDPAEYLPTCTVDDIANELSTIGFPTVEDIIQLRVSAAYHGVFRLTFSAASYDVILEKSGLTELMRSHVAASTAKVDTYNSENISLILRISGSHIPTIKTSNEVGILAYLTRFTSIPVPQIIHYDNTTQNALKSEYMIMTCMSGQTGSDLYASLSNDQMSHILDQLVDICLELYSLNFSHIGGLRPDPKTEAASFSPHLQGVDLVPGPPLMETMWQSPDIDRYFHDPAFNASLSAYASATPSFTSLNAVAESGYTTYTSWISAQAQAYIYAIETHSSLDWVQELDPNLTALRSFHDILETDTMLQAKLNDIPLKLAHRDLHFGNILLSPNPTPSSSLSPSTASASASASASTTTGHKEPSYTITGILDWEFASVLPFPLWRHSFLRDGIHTPLPEYTSTREQFFAASSRARERLYSAWAEKVDTRGGEVGRQMLRDARWRCPEQEAAWDVVNYLRCIVEVCPRREQERDARKWWAGVVRALKVFGIVV